MLRKNFSLILLALSVTSNHFSVTAASLPLSSKVDSQDSRDYDSEGGSAPSSLGKRSRNLSEGIPTPGTTGSMTQLTADTEEISLVKRDRRDSFEFEKEEGAKIRAELGISTGTTEEPGNPETKTSFNPSANPQPMPYVSAFPNTSVFVRPLSPSEREREFWAKIFEHKHQTAFSMPKVQIKLSDYTFGKMKAIMSHKDTQDTLLVSLYEKYPELFLNRYENGEKILRHSNPKNIKILIDRFPTDPILKIAILIEASRGAPVPVLDDEFYFPLKLNTNGVLLKMFQNSPSLFIGNYNLAIDSFKEVLPRLLLKLCTFVEENRQLKIELFRIAAKFENVNLGHEFFSNCERGLIYSFLEFSRVYPVRQEILEQLYTSPSNLSNRLANGQTVLTQVILDNRMDIVKILMQRSDAGSLLLLANSKHRFPINLARESECPEDACENIAALTWKRIRQENLFPILQELISTVSIFHSRGSFYASENLARVINERAYGDPVILMILLAEIKKCKDGRFWALENDIVSSLEI